MIHSFSLPRIAVVFVSLIGLLSLQCETQSVTPDNNPVFLIPMKVGNAWYYQTDHVDTLGIVITSTNTTVNIYADSLTGAERWFGFFSEGYRMNKPQGVWQLQPTPFLEFPLTVGDSVLRGNGTTYTHLLSKGTRVTVPAGTFVCYEYAETNPINNALLNKFYLTLSLGVVKREIFSGFSQYPDTVSQLITYTILPGSS
jgi:hypothetical protein